MEPMREMIYSLRSSPRKRGSRVAENNARIWIPAFAGMSDKG